MGIRNMNKPGLVSTLYCIATNSFCYINIFRHTDTIMEHLTNLESYIGLVKLAFGFTSIHNYSHNIKLNINQHCNRYNCHK